MAEFAYPLTRTIWVYIDRQPDKYLEPKLLEFLRYIVSRQGQEDVAAGGTYLPLTKTIVENELSSLGKWAR